VARDGNRSGQRSHQIARQRQETQKANKRSPKAKPAKTDNGSTKDGKNNINLTKGVEGYV
jgi:hypothetical protein